MNLPEEIFVVIAEHDLCNRKAQESGESRPIVCETGLDCSSLSHAKSLAKRMAQNGYGETKIGRVVLNQFDQIQSAKASLSIIDSDGEAIDRLIALMENWKSSAPDRFHDAKSAKSELCFEVLKWIRSL